MAGELSDTDLAMSLLIELTETAKFSSQMNPFASSKSADALSVEIEASRPLSSLLAHGLCIDGARVLETEIDKGSAVLFKLLAFFVADIQH